MKFIDRLILGLFAVLMLLIAVFSCFIIAGWVDITTVCIMFSNILKDSTTRIVLIVVNGIIILLSLKAIFFEGRDSKEEYEEKNGILLQNDDGRLLITKETLKNMVNTVVNGFSSVKNVQTKIILDSNNDLSIMLAIEVSDNAIIKELSNNIQMKVKDTIKSSMDIEVKNMDIKVTNIVAEQSTQEGK